MAIVNVHYAEDYHEILRIFRRIEPYDIVIYHYSVPQVKRFIQTYRPPDRLETVEPIGMAEPLLLDNVRSVTIRRYKYRTKFYTYATDDSRYVKIIKGYPLDLIRLGFGSTRERSHLHLQGYHPDGSVAGLVNDPVAYVAREIRSKTFDLDSDYDFTWVDRVINSAFSHASVHMVKLIRVDDLTFRCELVTDYTAEYTVAIEVSLYRDEVMFRVITPHEDDIYIPCGRLRQILRDRLEILNERR